jgi:hypothetical protein
MNGWSKEKQICEFILFELNIYYIFVAEKTIQNKTQTYR